MTANLAASVFTDGNAVGDAYGGIEIFCASAFAGPQRGDAGANRLERGDGDDVLRGRFGFDSTIGGEGSGTVSYADAGAGVVVSLALDVDFKDTACRVCRSQPALDGAGEIRAITVQRRSAGVIELPTRRPRRSRPSGARRSPSPSSTPRA